MNCSKCNAWVPEDSAFCPECGQKIEAPAPEAPAPETPTPVVSAPEANVFCPNCGAAMAAGDSFCENCGAKVEEVPKAPAAAPLAAVAAAFKKIPAKVLKLGAAVVAVILVIVIIASLFSGPKVFNYGLYIKDGELFYSKMPKGKDPIELTSSLTEDSLSNSTLAEMADYMGSRIHLSEDGKKLFFPDKIEDVEYYGYFSTFTLYYRDITNSKKEAEKIDSDISSYTINEKGTLVIYRKDGNLYQHDLKEKTKIASDVVSYRVSEDCKTILYLVREDDEDAGTLYLKKGNKDAEKVASDVTSITNVDEDFKNILYTKDGSLYLKKGSKDAEKIASDVNYVMHVYEDGTFYYTKTEEGELTYWDLIDDDYEDKESWEYEMYSESLKESEVYLDIAALYYFNGKESTVISEYATGASDYAVEEPILIYSALADSELPSWSLTKYINGEVSIYEELDEYVEENSMVYIAAGEKVGELGLEELRDAMISADGKTVYATAEYDSEDRTVTLHKLTLNGEKVKKSEQLDEDVYASYYYMTGEDSIIYYKDVEDGEGELYLDGKHVDDDVYIYNTSYNTETEDLYYIIDWNDEKDLGTLKSWNGKKSVSVKDDVHEYLFTPEGEVLFLYDYSTENDKGELWIYNGKKAVKLDDDVVAIVLVY